MSVNNFIFKFAITYFIDFIIQNIEIIVRVKLDIDGSTNVAHYAAVLNKPVLN